ncbi:hypothetical protein, partial [Bacillus thuringiensis]|uniref:hypothetical protein n=1 Tax=Bacillus thuringiensis TaxID=1428 RepID=UPI002868F5E4
FLQSRTVLVVAYACALLNRERLARHYLFLLVLTLMLLYAFKKGIPCNCCFVAYKHILSLYNDNFVLT